MSDPSIRYPTKPPPDAGAEAGGGGGRPRVVISGWGLVSPLGHSAWETFAALLAGRTIADRADQLPEAIALVDLVRALGCVSFAQHSPADPAVELAERAAREAIFMAGGATDEPPPDAILGVSKGAVYALTAAGVSSPADAALALRGSRTGPPPPLPADAALAVALGPAGYLGHHLRRRLHLGEVSCTVAACASSLTALHQARQRLLDAPDGAGTTPRRVLVVTAEAALLPAFIHSYARLGVLPPLTPALYRGLPLNAKRYGFMLAELAAAVVLERVESGAALPTGAIELVDTAVACEGFDLVRTPPGMPALRRVAERLLAGRAVDVLHPHATGTAENDAVELDVYAIVLGSGVWGLGSGPEKSGRHASSFFLPQSPDPRHQTLPDLYASKGALGHGLGAAGLVSLVLACLCAKTGRRPPMRWLDEPIASPLPLRVEPLASHRAPRPSTHAVFAAGFGGHVAGAVVRTP